MSYQPGLYDRRITFKENEATQSTSSGAYENVWTEFKTVAARRLINSGAETVTADRLENTNAVTWEIPYCYNLTPKMRIYEGTERFDILTIIEVGRKEKIRIETIKIYAD